MSKKPTYQELEQKVRMLQTDLSVIKQSGKDLALHAEIVKAAPLGITVYNAHGKCIIANAAAAKLIGATVDQVLAQNFHDIPSWKTSGLYDQALDALSQDTIRYEEISLISSFGKRVSLRFRFAPFLFCNERHLSLIYEDITAQIDLQNALSETSQQFKAMIEASPIAITFLDVKGKVILWSQAAEKMFGWKAKEVIGQLNPMVPSEKLDEFSENLRQVLSGGAVENMEIRRQKKDGSPIDLNLFVVPLRNADKQIVGVIGMMTDITERKKSEIEKDLLQRQLIQAQKMESIGIMAGGIAHDFNNILSAVIGFTELALDDAEKGSFMENNLNEVYTAGKRARDLVRQILAFARQSDSELKPIRVDTIAKEALKSIRVSVPSTIRIKPSIASQSVIMGNPAQFHQILMNLWTNAAQAMEAKGGTLEVSTTDITFEQGAPDQHVEGLDSGDYVEIIVSDTGEGIAPQHIGAIFDPYFTTKGPGEGSGMGLAVTYGIIETFGGKIIVDSELGKGTTFRLYFPTTTTTNNLDVLQHPGSETLPTGTEHILLVDDETSIAKLGTRLLRRLGYSTTMRTNSVEALALFRERPDDFDLLITDMTMPNLTGDKLAAAVMKERPDIPVILCTGYSKKMSDEKALKLGIKAFAYKPIIKADLAKTVRKVLDKAKVNMT